MWVLNSIFGSNWEVITGGWRKIAYRGTGKFVLPACIIWVSKMWHVWGGREMYVGFWWGGLKK